ncbi:MAG: transporter, family, D-galactonate transporter [Acetobacteraceae bacterium]|jgi:ACS family D-galactonate transporter-like MFS transporter|nr:transporter, family, D-galactonate transporter [Acetobacteraceae bacterium]
MDDFVSATTVSGMTNVRWRIFLLILGTVAINYIDRASLSVAMPVISREFNISPAIQGLLLSSFFWSYCAMQIPGGLLADRFLPRSVIAGATVAWGGFAALAAASTGWITMLLTRVGLGLAEGPIYPAGAKLIGMWMTPTERGRAAALLDGGAPLGTALGSLIIAGLIAALGSWRLAFLVAGLGTMACGAFGWFYIRNHPHEHESVNHQERIHIQDGLDRSAAGSRKAVPLTQVFRSPSIWMLFVGWFCFNSLWYGFLTWVPSFLAKTQGLNIAALGWASFLVFFAGFVGELTGGQLLDHWLRSGAATEKVYRRLFGISAGLATIAVFLVAYVHDEAVVITLLATTLFFLRWCGMYWTLPGLLIGDEKAGFLAGAMNFAGNISGIVIPVTVGLIVSITGSYYLALMVFATAGAGLFLCSVGMRYRRAV